MPDFDTDRNLLFGVIALQSDLIDSQQFVDACTLWSSRKSSSLAEVLVQQGWLTDEDRVHVEYLLARRLQKQSGSVRRSLATLPVEVRSALAGIDDKDIHKSLQGLEDARDTIVASPSFPPRPDRVVLKGLHSTGGIGQVWLAYDPVLQREIALKELRADKAKSRRNHERFFREAQLTGQLEHPGIVPVYDFHQSDDGSRCYYTMRFVKGHTLTEAIQNYHKSQSASGAGMTAELIRLLSMFAKLCQTIAYAHSRNVIHRDLKGDNVVVGDFGEVIVLDWGLAKRLDQPEPAPVPEPEPEDDSAPHQTMVSDDLPAHASATMHGEKLGTPAYMAPEQARGHVDMIDKRTDVYGLAAILYEILTGRPPFVGSSIVEILDAVMHQQPLPPSELHPGLPRDLEQICLKGLSKARGDRQQSAAELAEAVQNWIARRAERKRTEQERERFFNLSLDLLGILDAEGRLQQTNPAWNTLLGWDSSELDGQPVRELLHADDRQLLTRDLQRILSGEPLTAVEYRCRCHDGSYRWVQWNASLIAGESAIYIVGRDITERKHTEQTFRELLESAPDAMVVVSASGRIVIVNAQLERLFRYSRDELLGEPIEILVPEEFRERHAGHVARFARDPQFRPMASGLELRGCRKDGSLFPAEISLSPVRTEQGLLISCAVRDVSSRDNPRHSR